MVNRRIPQYENKIAILSQDIERLNQALKQRTDELENSRRQIREMEMKFQNVTSSASMQEMQTSRKFSMYEENQNRLNRENEDLKRKLQEIVELKRFIQELENRHSISQQELQKVNQALRQREIMLTCVLLVTNHIRWANKLSRLEDDGETHLDKCSKEPTAEKYYKHV